MAYAVAFLAGMVVGIAFSLAVWITEDRGWLRGRCRWVDKGKGRR